MFKTEQIQERFFKKVNKTTNCWQWIASKTPQGYGRFFVNNRWHLAHRVSLALFLKIPLVSNTKIGAGGQVVMHLCDNTSCVNPKHLRLADQKTNIKDCHTKKRAFLARGSKSGRTSLSELDVKQIRTMLRSEKYSQIEISKLFQVSKYVINNIKNNRSWTHV